MSTRADSAAWQIHERAAPSPRGYLRLVNAWITRVRAAVLALWDDPRRVRADAVDDDLQLELFRQRLHAPGALPPPPTPRDVAAVGAPAHRQAMRAARQGLLYAGLPRQTLQDRIALQPNEQLLGIDIAPTPEDRATLTRWARRGTDLIRTVERDLVVGIDEHIMRAAREGTPTSALRDVLVERLGISERHGQLIARTEIARLNSAVTESTQRQAGVERYKWRSAHDSRVRPRHRELDGTVHAWSQPPAGAGPYGDPAHPGSSPNCRCVAIPVVDGADVTPTPKYPAPDASNRPLPAPRPQPLPRPAPRIDPAEVERAAHLDQWVHGSKRKASVAWKQAAIDELGAGGVPFSRVAWNFTEADRAAARRAVRLQYDMTQTALAAQRVQVVKLYRGVKGQYDAAGSLESWTTDIATARKFAGPSGVVIVEDVPASRILAHSGGPGWKNGKFGEQHEWIVLGERP